MRAALCLALAVGAVLPALAADTKPGTCAKPVWPEEARRYELEGNTTLRFRLSEEGRVIDTAVARSSRWELLDGAAIKALSACEFRNEIGKKTNGAWLPVQYVWALGGVVRSHPLLLDGSCMASERFSRFAPFDKGVTGPDGVLVRLLVRRDGTPFGVKAEGGGADPAQVEAAIDYVQSCRFERDREARTQHTDTVTGRVLLK